MYYNQQSDSGKMHYLGLIICCLNNLLPVSFALDCLVKKPCTQRNKHTVVIFFLQMNENFGSAPQIFIESLWCGKHCSRPRGTVINGIRIWRWRASCAVEGMKGHFGHPQTSEAYPERTVEERWTLTSSAPQKCPWAMSACILKND